MAAPALPRLTRRLLRAAAALLAAAVVIAALLLLAAWIGSAIPRNPDWTQSRSGVDIMVETNGVHTGIVMPIVTPQKDWRGTFPPAGLPRADGRLPTHIAVGWGEREVFLTVPTWSDLKPSTALRIATTGGDAVMRVSHYVRPAPGTNHRPLRIDPDTYARLVARIEASLGPVPDGGRRTVLRGTDPADAYYDAKGHYTLGNTCNSWVGDTLAHAGIRMGWFTPFAGGVMKWVPVPPAPGAAPPAE